MINDVILMIEDDVKKCEDTLSKQSDCQELFEDLVGKYRTFLEGFPTITDNPLYLRNHHEEYRSNIQKICGFLKMYLVSNKSPNPSGTIQDIDYKKIFIVHGHDEALKQAVARIIERQKIDAIILTEQSSAGSPTVIEKFEANSGVVTKNEKNEIESEKYRARQNVVFEAGYFMGKLSRNRVIIIADKKIELPSDLIGPIYVDKDSWKIDLLKNLKAIGYDIDFSLIN